MLLRRNNSDSFGCAIVALDGEARQVVRDHIESTGAAPCVDDRRWSNQCRSGRVV
jgi:hypothetical protein